MQKNKSINNEQEQEIIIHIFSHIADNTKQHLHLNKNKKQVQHIQNYKIKQSEKIYDNKMIKIIYQERKNQNLLRLKNYDNQRIKFYEDYIDIVQYLYQKLYNKCLDSYNFFTKTIQYFDSIREIYKVLNKGLEKINNLSYSNSEKNHHNWYSLLQQGMKNLMNFKLIKCQQFRNVSEWISKQFINNLKNSIQNMLSPFQSYRNDIQKLKKKYQRLICKLEQKIKRIFNLYKSQSKTEIFDLLSEQLELYQLHHQIYLYLIKWGQIILKIWQYVEQLQCKLYNVFKERILHFLHQLSKYGDLDQLKYLKNEWQSLQINQLSIFSSLLSIMLKQSHINLIKNALSSQICHKTNLKKFLKLQFESVIFIQPEQLINNIYIKKFDAKIISKTLVEKIVIYFSIDEFLIIYSKNEKTIKKKVLIKQLYYKQNSQLTVSIFQKQKGFLIDTWNQQNIIFKNIDQLQQFTYMLIINHH